MGVNADRIKERPVFCNDARPPMMSAPMCERTSTEGEHDWNGESTLEGSRPQKRKEGHDEAKRKDMSTEQGKAFSEKKEKACFSNLFALRAT